MTTEHISVPRDDYEALVRLSRRALHTAYVWNDHNHQPVKALAKSDAVDFGIRSIDEATDFIDRSEAILSRATPSTRQYFYKVTGCPAMLPSQSNCICWHDENSGPLDENDQKDIDLEWRQKPVAPRVVTDKDVERAAEAMASHNADEISEWYRDKARAALESFATSLPAAREPDGLISHEIEDCITAIKNGMSPSSKIFIPRGWNVVLEKLEAMLAAAPKTEGKV